MKASASIIRLFILACWLVLLPGIFLTASAQTDTTATQTQPPQRWVVETKDGSVYQGIFLKQDGLGIHLRTESAGDVIIPIDKVKSYRILEERNYKNGEYWYENPNSTRYLFSPSAYSLRKGEAYYQNTYLVLNSFNYGVTDNFTIGGGFELISTFSGEPTFFFTPKYTFKLTDKWRAGGGVLYLTSTLADDGFTGVGIGYGIVTYGNTDNNATLGMGYGFVDGDLASKPIVTLSGMTRVSRKLGLVTENWFVPSEDISGGIFSYGLRFMGERITVDLAFLNNADIAESVAIGVPYVDFVVKFGK
ncbi:hypothetical protein H7F15_08025 [Pontibacter sp. Tf4]|uniref:hypothetical protein n=1 Tax=Pontibacter sp. Tf4 TaxID=2761620 RepID=UPI001629A6B8|nr:hypothetical protein [Pontibacter sp. Tf4]MBB6610980.1 hypothetical protein [Pontibacter sp. Tf4]